jgi:hypothetical protein
VEDLGRGDDHIAPGSGPPDTVKSGFESSGIA